MHAYQSFVDTKNQGSGQIRILRNTGTQTQRYDNTSRRTMIEGPAATGNNDRSHTNLNVLQL
jgi:hypothetical protein